MAKSGPETRLVKKMRDAGTDKYGERLVLTKYHGSAFSEAGVSDLLGTLDGVFLAIEVKSPETRHGVTLKQQAYINRVLIAGGVAAVCDSVDGFLETLAEAERLAAWLPNREPVITPTEIICTCPTAGPGAGCEYLTEGGCFYCRNVDAAMPCPNNTE